MIQTFSSVVKNAADLQKARNAYAAYAANIGYKDGATAATEVYVEVDTTEYYKVQNRKVDETATITTQADDIVINPEGTKIHPAG